MFDHKVGELDGPQAQAFQGWRGLNDEQGLGGPHYLVDHGLREMLVEFLAAKSKPVYIAILSSRLISSFLKVLKPKSFSMKILVRSLLSWNRSLNLCS